MFYAILETIHGLMRRRRTTILGHNISAPIFINPAAAPGAVGGYVPKNREEGLIQGAYSGNILYIPALYAEMSIEEMAAAKKGCQIMFQQVSHLP